MEVSGITKICKSNSGNSDSVGKLMKKGSYTKICTRT